MRTSRALPLVVASLVVTAGCARSDVEDGAGPSPLTAQDEFDRVTTALSTAGTVRQVIALTPDNDPDQMNGADPGYEVAAVIHDESLKCPDPDVDCGLLVEVWPDSDAAQRRVDEQYAFVQVDAELGMGIHRTAGRVVLFASPGLSDESLDDYYAAFDNATAQSK